MNIIIIEEFYKIFKILLKDLNSINKLKARRSEDTGVEREVHLPSILSVPSVLSVVKNLLILGFYRFLVVVFPRRVICGRAP